MFPFTRACGSPNSWVSSSYFLVVDFANSRNMAPSGLGVTLLVFLSNRVAFSSASAFFILQVRVEGLR